MSRKKNTRSASGKKTQSKAKTTTLSLTEKLEKDFRDAPAKLVSEYRKEIAVLKQQEIKLKTELKKAHMLQKALKTKHAALSAKKLTATAKKQLTTAKKVQAELIKATKDFTAKLDQIKNQIKTLSDKQAKYTVIGKQCAILQKQLTKKAVKTKSAVKTSKKSAKKTKSATSTQNQPTHTPEITVDETETAELTS